MTQPCGSTCALCGKSPFCDHCLVDIVHNCDRPKTKEREYAEPSSSENLARGGRGGEVVEPPVPPRRGLAVTVASAGVEMRQSPAVVWLQRGVTAASQRSGHKGKEGKGKDEGGHGSPGGSAAC